MSVLGELSETKGKNPENLARGLAQQALYQNRTDILLECANLTSYYASSASFRHIRSGAARVVEIVAEKKPELVAPILERLFPALSVQELQTRCTIMRILGMCARAGRGTAQKAIGFAEKFIDAKEGLTLSCSTDLFLGSLGSISKMDAGRVFPLLEQSMENPLEDEHDCILEALLMTFPNLEEAERNKVLKIAERWQNSSQKSVQFKAEKILRLSGPGMRAGERRAKSNQPATK